MNKNTLWWVLAILIVVVVGIFLYRSSQNAMNTSPATSNQTGEISGNVNPTTPTSTQTSGGSTSTNTPATVTVNVSGGNYYFAPNAITVKKDQTVTIHFTNAGGIHDLVLQEFGVSTPPRRQDRSSTIAQWVITGLWA